MVTGTLHLKDKYITQLSGGEKQRVIFARALAQQTPVLLLDEATSNVDVRYRLQLLQYVQRKNMQEKQTVIAVFQDINLAARFCDHLLFIKQGQIFAQGPIEEILCASTLKDVFDVEAKIFFEKNTKCRQVIFEIESES
jgi:iron complex transport system ATP-binding protein